MFHRKHSHLKRHALAALIPAALGLAASAGGLLRRRRHAQKTVDTAEPMPHRRGYRRRRRF